MANGRNNGSGSVWFVPALISALILVSAGAARADQPIAQAETPPAATATPPPLASPTEGPPNIYDGKVHTTLAPYIWAPNINGTLKFQVPAILKNGGDAFVNIKAGPNDYLSSLNFAIMASGEVRKGNLALFLDYINLNLSTSTGSLTTISGPNGHIEFPISLDTSSRVTGTMWLIAPSFTIAHGKAGAIDVLAGARGLDSTIGASWNLTAGSNDLINRSGTISQGVSFTDFVVGARGKVNLGTPRWFIPYYIDFGWGDSNTTWRGQIGIGLGARHGQSLILGVRTLQYNMSGNNVLQSIRFTGPGLGYTFLI